MVSPIDRLEEELFDACVTQVLAALVSICFDNRPPRVKR